MGKEIMIDGCYHPDEPGLDKAQVSSFAESHTSVGERGKVYCSKYKPLEGGNSEIEGAVVEVGYLWEDEVACEEASCKFHESALVALRDKNKKEKEVKE